MKLETIECSLFFANYGYNFLFGFKSYTIFAKAILSVQINAKKFINIIKNHLVFLKKKIVAAQAKYKDNIN